MQLVNNVFLVLFAVVFASCGPVTRVTVNGTVVDGDGNPVEGAEVRIDPENGGCCAAEDMTPRECVYKTDDSGKFSLFYVTGYDPESEPVSYESCAYTVSKAGFSVFSSAWEYCKISSSCQEEQTVQVDVTLTP